MDSLSIGDKVKWVSAAGKLTGTVYNIAFSKNAAHDLVPWIMIKSDKGNKVTLCGTVNNMKMMKLEKNVFTLNTD
jgi:aromatic ring-cleaving dioxygenase